MEKKVEIDMEPGVLQGFIGGSGEFRDPQTSQVKGPQGGIIVFGDLRDWEEQCDCMGGNLGFWTVWSL